MKSPSSPMSQNAAPGVASQEDLSLWLIKSELNEEKGPGGLFWGALREAPDEVWASLKALMEENPPKWLKSAWVGSGHKSFCVSATEQAKAGNPRAALRYAQLAQEPMWRDFFGTMRTNPEGARDNGLCYPLMLFFGWMVWQGDPKIAWGWSGLLREGLERGAKEWQEFSQSAKGQENKSASQVMTQALNIFISSGRVAQPEAVEERALARQIAKMCSGRQENKEKDRIKYDMEEWLEPITSGALGAGEETARFWESLGLDLRLRQVQTDLTRKKEKGYDNKKHLEINCERDARKLALGVKIGWWSQDDMKIWMTQAQEREEKTFLRHLEAESIKLGLAPVAGPAEKKLRV